MKYIFGLLVALGVVVGFGFVGLPYGFFVAIVAAMMVVVKMK